MEQHNESPQLLKEKLSILASSGIKVNSKRLKEDMCSQFSDYREWIREYVVNSFDANASKCVISGREDDESVTITVKDNGHGMNREQILNFFTLYRSDKTQCANTAVGRFGIGKLSVAIIPGFCHFYVKTCDGNECWIAETNSFLENEPISFEQIDSLKQTGTLFEITFNKTISLKDELYALKDILYTYLRYLAIEIVLIIPGSGNEPEKEFLINSRWNDVYNSLAQSYIINLGSKTYEVVLSLGKTANELYQNKVFITNKYNLLAHDLCEKYSIPYLNIKVESADFELPFGRHCLINENDINELSREIRNTYLSKYFNYLINNFHEVEGVRLHITWSIIEEIACSLLKNLYKTDQAWLKIKLFNVYPSDKISYDELEKKIVKSNVLYLADNEVNGIDFSVFDGPVLLPEQPGIGLELLKNCFKKYIVPLDSANTVFEATEGRGPQLQPFELKFQEYLSFTPEVLNASTFKHLEDDFSADMQYVDPVYSSGIVKTLENSKYDLNKIKWRLNYLFEKNGQPCYTHRFIFKRDTTILNLYHKDVRNLVNFSQKAPTLAAHWLMATCLTEGNTILSHLTDDLKEDLLVIDAITKVEKLKNKKVDFRDNVQLLKALNEYFINNNSNLGFSKERSN